MRLSGLNLVSPEGEGSPRSQATGHKNQGSYKIITSIYRCVCFAEQIQDTRLAAD